ncbi:MAG: hypothetical protein Q9217_004236 [Psora testacea]
MAVNFRARYVQLQESEAAKNGLLENMLDEIDRLNVHLADINGQLEPLIDGDCMNFRDDLVQAAEAGGQEAAQLLRSSIIDHVHDQIPDIQHEFDVLVYVYANLRGLAKAYGDAKIIQQREDLDRFVRGFNMGHGLVNIIDAGNGKECSDAKIRELFRIQIGDVHCKHLIFGGSSDNGYARLLGPYCGNDNVRERITMLEGPRFAPELAMIASKVKTASFPKLFRDTKIEARPTSNIPPPPGLTPARNSNGTSKSYASRAAAPAPAHVTLDIPPPSNPKSAPPTQLCPEGIIGRNSEGQRVDLPIKPSAAIATALKPKKLCNNHHLRGDCRNPNCQYEHGVPLEGQEREALRFLARQVPCQDELYCEDPYCYYGHRFPSSMHEVDETIVEYS